MFWTKQARISGLICQPTNGGKSEVDRPRRQSAGLKVYAISCDYDFVESQTRFGAIPIDELADCMLITTSRVRRSQTSSDCRFGMVEIYETKRYRIALFSVEFLHKQPLPNGGL